MEVAGLGRILQGGVTRHPYNGIMMHVSCITRLTPSIFEILYCYFGGVCDACVLCRDTIGTESLPGRYSPLLLRGEYEMLLAG